MQLPADDFPVPRHERTRCTPKTDWPDRCSWRCSSVPAWPVRTCPSA